MGNDEVSWMEIDKRTRLESELKELESSEPVEKPTDEDINKVALALTYQFYDLPANQAIYLSGYIGGAKAMRDNKIPVK